MSTMNSNDISVFERLSDMNPNPFYIATVMAIIGFFSYGSVLVGLVESNAFINATILFARPFALLGMAGLIPAIVEKNELYGKIAKIMVSLAIFANVGLLIFGALSDLGVTIEIAMVLFGITTPLLSLLTFIFLGVVLVQTQAYDPQIGWAVLANAAVLLGIFLSLVAAGLPPELMGTVHMGLVIAIYFYLANNVE